jgi:hypothetical protein
MSLNLVIRVAKSSEGTGQKRGTTSAGDRCGRDKAGRSVRRSSTCIGYSRSILGSSTSNQFIRLSTSVQCLMVEAPAD